ncbi:FMN-binding glutamate synthase family protein [Agaribacterium sp. ZY112]|uniref:FMN-binding glutamate synthase family protein n=1 Tax=Agaribacterium sp. ZY112 TaxID=3233574 RepID=UPI003523654D
MNDHFALTLVGYLALAFSSIIVLGFFYVIVLYFVDINQHKHTIRHNYPVVGRFRYVFEHLGTFFRQYFFALDREELPFNRAIRSWVYRAAKKDKLSNAFGSSNDLSKTNLPIFLNSPYPVLDEEQKPSLPPLIGPHCSAPYQPSSFFNISGMSFGALSKAAVLSLSSGAAKAGCWMNTGEGGLSPYHLEGKCDLVFQIGTARYGVRHADGSLNKERLLELDAMANIKMFEIKLSQGAKPGKGGILPADKVSAEIAMIRGIEQGQASVSPNRQPDIHNDEELLSFIAELKLLLSKPVGIKFVLGEAQWIDGLCEKISRGPQTHSPDFFTIDGAEGGTGAAPQALMDFVGLPLRYSLPLVRAAVDKYKLQEQIRIIASGKLISPSSVAWALASGADYCTSARGFMFSLGCIQAMQCHQNTCPTGITTQDEKLQKGLNPTLKSTRVANYHDNLVSNVEVIAHSCGQSCASELNNSNIGVINTNDNFSHTNLINHVSS